MNRSLLLSTRILLALPFACALLYACDGHDHEEEPGPPSGYEDVRYEGAVTDEALVALAGALDQGPPVEGSPNAPALVAPADAELPASPIPTFTWTHSGVAARRAPPALLRVAATQELRASETWLAPLRDLLGPARAAHAHGTPFTGYGTFLTFAVSGNDKLLRVLTSETDYTPAQDAWDALVAAKAPITLTLIGADFEENRVAQGGGPFLGSTSTFTIAAP